MRTQRRRAPLRITPSSACPRTAKTVSPVRAIARSAADVDGDDAIGAAGLTDHVGRQVVQKCRRRRGAVSPVSTGGNTPGMAIVDREGPWASEPESKTTTSALRTSVATHRNGVGSASKSTSLPNGAGQPGEQQFDPLSRAEPGRQLHAALEAEPQLPTG